MSKTTASKDNKKPKLKIALFFLIFIYLLIGLVLFGLFFTSIYSVQSFVVSSSFWSKVLFSLGLSPLREKLFIICLILTAVFSVIFFIFKAVKKFPPAVTVLAMSFNSAICIIVKSMFFIFEKYNIFFEVQVLNILPIITIILSLVFLIYDYIDFVTDKDNHVAEVFSLPNEKVIEETIENLTKHYGNKNTVPSSFEEEILIEELERDEDENYRNEDGYFNNDALEKAANIFMSSINENKAK